MPSAFRSLATHAARAAYDKKAENIVLLDIHRLSSLADYALLVDVQSPAHLEAVEAAVSELLEGSGVELLHRDGAHSGLWRVLDFGGLIVHLTHPEARAFYALDKLYRDAPKQRWQPRARKKA